MFFSSTRSSPNPALFFGFSFVQSVLSFSFSILLVFCLHDFDQCSDAHYRGTLLKRKSVGTMVDCLLNFRTLTGIEKRALSTIFFSHALLKMNTMNIAIWTDTHKIVDKTLVSIFYAVLFINFCSCDLSKI